LEPLLELPTEVLVTRARGGCRDSFGVLAERYAKGVYNFLLQRTRSREDAEELCQESFLRAWRKLATYDGEWSFSTWVYAIARSLAADRARVRAVDATAEVLRDHAGPEDHARDLDRREESENLWLIARAVLDDDQHAALWLFYAEERSAAEIGAILGRTSIAVRLLMFRARSILGRHLEQREKREARAGRSLRTPMETMR
jgi:RNA polymerase sigma-70 factor (ECF subfamily)